MAIDFNQFKELGQFGRFPFSSGSLPPAIFFDDFIDEYALTSNLPVAASSPWIGTALNSGTFAQTDAVNEAPGVATLSGAATTDDSGVQIQQDTEWICLNAGKWTCFTTRVKLSDGTQDELFAGIALTDTTLIDGAGTMAAGLTHTDSIAFYKPDGEATIYGIIRRDSTSGAASHAVTGAISATLTDWAVLSFVVQMDTTAGSGTVIFYINGTEVGRLSSSTMPYAAEEPLAISLATLSGVNTGTKTCKVDFVGVMQER